MEQQERADHSMTPAAYAAELAEAKRELAEMRKALEGMRSYLEELSITTRRLEEGYDFHILSRFTKQIFREVHDLEKEEGRCGDDEARRQCLANTREGLLELLDRQSIRTLTPQPGTPYAGQEREAECLVEKVPTTDAQLCGCVARVVRCGFLYEFGDDQSRVLEPAKVQLYELTAPETALAESEKAPVAPMPRWLWWLPCMVTLGLLLLNLWIGWRLQTWGHSAEQKPSATVAVEAVVSTPAETNPAEVKPAEVKPAEVKPAEVKPAEVKSAEVKSAEVKSAEVKSAEVKSAEVKSAEVKSAEVKSAEVKSAEVKSAEVKSAEVKPVETKTSASAEAEPVEVEKKLE